MAEYNPVTPLPQIKPAVGGTPTTGGFWGSDYQPSPWTYDTSSANGETGQGGVYRNSLTGETSQYLPESPTWHDGMQELSSNGYDNLASGGSQYLDPAHGMASAWDPTLYGSEDQLGADSVAALRKLGFSGDMFTKATDPSGGQDTISGTPARMTDDFTNWMRQNGIRPSSYAEGSGTNIDFTGSGGNLIGSHHQDWMQAPELMYAMAGGLGAVMAPAMIAGMSGTGASLGAEGLSGMDLAADAGMGGANSVGGAAAAYDAGAAGSLGAANGSWDVLPSTDGYGGDAWDQFGNMGGGGGGSGSWFEPPAGAGSSLLTNAKSAIGIGKDLYGALKPGAAGGSGGATGPFTGGMSAGDRYRQQLAAQSIRELGQKEPGFQSVWSGPAS